MTTLLQRVMAEAERLTTEDQDAIAARWLAELEDERRWAEQFASTTDAQWDRMIAEVDRDISEGRTVPLDTVFPPDETSK